MAICNTKSGLDLLWVPIPEMKTEYEEEQQEDIQMRVDEGE